MTDETPMTDEQREAYAPPGTVLRSLLDNGTCWWPTVEEAERERSTLDLIRDGKVTLLDLEEWVHSQVLTNG